MLCPVNSVWPNDTIWCTELWSTLVEVMTLCHWASSHYPNQCWPITTEVLWYSNKSNFIKNSQDISQWNLIVVSIQTHFTGLISWTKYCTPVTHWCTSIIQNNWIRQLTITKLCFYQNWIGMICGLQSMDPILSLCSYEILWLVRVLVTVTCHWSGWIKATKPLSKPMAT